MRAVIAEIRGKYVAALSEDGCVRQLINRNYAVGQVIEIKPNLTFYKKFTARAVCAAAAVALVSASAWAYYTPYSYVSLDVNPSVEYSINRFGVVLSCKAVNDNGEKILDGLDLTGKDINSAVKETVQGLVDDGYLTKDETGGIVITTSSDNEEKSEKLADELEGSAENIAEKNDLNVEIDAERVGRNRVEEAKKLGVTPGKLNLVQKLQESASGVEINTDEWLKKPVKEIMKQIKEFRKADKKANSDIEQDDNTETQSKKEDAELQNNEQNQIKSQEKNIKKRANSNKVQVQSNIKTKLNKDTDNDSTISTSNEKNALSKNNIDKTKDHHSKRSDETE
ncbi:MAG: hypothetical protein N2Z65_02900 [Clostridiales bacterium]|nr:hypothetical protein [Clostridiales bacterium]